MPHWLFWLAPLTLSAGISSSTVVFQLLIPPAEVRDPVYSLSADGRAMGVNAGSHYYLWTAESGFQDLGPGHPLSPGVGLARDGSALCGTLAGPLGERVAAVWYPGRGWQRLPTRSGHRHAVALAMNAAGDVVGLTWSSEDAAASLWTAAGHHRLASNAHRSRATCLAGGTHVIGGSAESHDRGLRHPVLWVDGQETPIADPGLVGEVVALSANGAVACGHLEGRGFVRDEQGVLWNLSPSPHEAQALSRCLDVSDGSVAVGWTRQPGAPGTRAFIWLPRQGLMDLEAWLEQQDVSFPHHLTLTEAQAISDDGSCMVGAWTDSLGQTGHWRISGLSPEGYLRPADGAVASSRHWPETDREVLLPPPAAPGRPVRFR